MNLSKAQREVIENAKRKVDKARDLDYPQWLKVSANIRENVFEKCVEEGYMKEYWEAARNAQVCVHCNSRTLYRLVECGLIEIIKDSNGYSYGIDVIKVLNY